jgi:hypothetical protein
LFWLRERLSQGDMKAAHAGLEISLAGEYGR